MKLLNIVHNEELIAYDGVQYVNYVNIGDATSIDHSLLVMAPVLIVGYSLYKRLYKSQYEIDPLKKEVVKHTLYWEFSFNENKVQYFDGVFQMINVSILENYYGIFQYENIDPVFYSINETTDLYRLIGAPKYSYLYKEMMYIFSNDKVYGIDLKAYQYFGFGSELIKKRLLQTAKGHMVDENGEIYQKFYRAFPHATNLKRYIPLLLENTVK